jgi:hypothetical protein
MGILGPWVVFIVFLTLALFTERVWTAMCISVRLPRGLSARERHRIKTSDVPSVRALAALAATLSGFGALAITIQHVIRLGS